jgi:hypothetical protein
VILAQSLAVVGRRLSQWLRHLPRTRSADRDFQEQLCQPYRQFIRRHSGEQPNRRAKEPQMRPGSTPRRSKKNRRSYLHGEQRYRAGEAGSRPQCASQETGRAQWMKWPLGMGQRMEMKGCCRAAMEAGA